MTTPATIPKIGVFHIVTTRPSQATSVVTKATTWAEVNQSLAPLTKIPVKRGDPPLTVTYKVTWHDGFVAEGTYEIPYGKTADLAADIKKVWLYYAGFWRPDHMSEEDHNKALAQNPQRQEAATQTLHKYALDDDPAHHRPTTPAVPSVEFQDTGPTENDLMLAVEYATRLVQRAELPTATINPNHRALALELRKTLASLIRAQQIAHDGRKA